MKQSILIVALFFGTTVFSQTGVRDIKSIEKDIKSLNDSFSSMDKTAARLDSLNAQIKASIDRQTARIDSAEIANMTERSTSYFAQMSRQREAEQKKKMWMYLGMGTLGLVVLIVGLMRKRKKPINN